MQTLLGFTALLSSSYPPLSIHFLQPPPAASELKGLKSSVGVTECRGESEELAHPGGQNNTVHIKQHKETFETRSRFLLFGSVSGFRVWLWTIWLLRPDWLLLSAHPQSSAGSGCLSPASAGGWRSAHSPPLRGTSEELREDDARRR